MTAKPTPASQPSPAHCFNDHGYCLECNVHEYHVGARMSCQRPSPALESYPKCKNCRELDCVCIHRLPDQPSPARSDKEAEHQCWACQRTCTDEQRSEADGQCPHCGAEIDLGGEDEDDDRASQSTPAGEAVTTWEQHYALGSSKEGAMLFEIRDLRAALARRATAGTTAAPTCSGCDPAEGFCKVCREAERATADNTVPTEAEENEPLSNHSEKGFPCLCCDPTYLVSNTATAAPGDLPPPPSNEELEDLWESHVGHPADFGADMLERWGGWQMGILGYGGSLASNAGAASSDDLLRALREGIALQEPVNISKALRAERKAHVCLSGGTGPVACAMLVNIQLTGWAEGPETAEAFVKGYNTALKQYRGALLDLAPSTSPVGAAQEKEYEPCKNAMIRNGVQAIPRSCPRCGINKYCPRDGSEVGAERKAP